MKAGDLIKVSTEFGSYWAEHTNGGCRNIAGMIGIYLGVSQNFDAAAKVMMSNGCLYNVFEPHARIELINERG